MSSVQSIKIFFSHISYQEPFFSVFYENYLAGSGINQFML